MFLAIEASHANKEKRTGVEEYSWQIIQHLKKIIPSDTRVVLYTNCPLIAGLNELPPNWSAKVLPWKFKKGWSQIRLSWEFLKNPPDVFFAPGQLVPFISPKNTITTVHDSAFMVYPESYNFFGRQYLKLMNKMVIKKSKIILTPSEFSKNELMKYYGADKDKITVTPLGFDADTYKPVPDNARLDSRLRGNDKWRITKKFVLSVGRLENKKNTANIIRAYDLARKQCDCQLVLVGQPGVGYVETEQAINESPNKADIILTGWAGKEDIAVLMNAAEIFVFPSRYEGFGIPVLEAMASGCPVIASVGNSLVEVGREAAAYVSPDNLKELASSMVNILNDASLRQKMKERGLARAKEFSWQKTAEMTWVVLRQTAK